MIVIYLAYFHLPQDDVTLADPLAFLLPKTFRLYAFQSYDWTYN